jgi:hypothetical protein
MAAVTTYKVRAVKWDGGWELHLEGIGVTQARTLTAAPRMVRSYLELDGHDVPESSADAFEWSYDLGGLEDAVRTAREAVRSAERGQQEAAALSRAAARALVRDAGLTGADAAEVLGVSPQRGSQLVKG